MNVFTSYLLIALAILLPVSEAYAHKPSDSYLRLQITGNSITGTWDIALLDLENTAKLDTHGDRKAIEQFALQHLVITAGTMPCSLRIDDTAGEEDEQNPAITLKGECPTTITTLTIDYSPILGIDWQYRGLVFIKAGGADYTTALSSENPYFTFRVASADYGQQFRDYLREGMWHIWLGFDHMLFLIALLLPSAWIYRKGILRTDMPFGTVFWEVFTYISAFTIAHAITLALALFDLLHVGSRLVEPLIALTIVLSCLNNLFPFLKQRLWMLTFGFGLIHGMGFATTLTELGLTSTARWVALLGFNVGVELGQLLIVAILLPIFYTARKHKGYRILVRGLSLVILAIAGIWFVQRAFGIIIFRFLRY